MKGYRKLVPGEEIRTGDRLESDAWHAGGEFIGSCPGDLYEGATIWRKARTGGCPPGWRWADAGETGEHFKNISGAVDAGNPFKALADEDGDWAEAKAGYVMPYPEDPRLGNK